MRARSARKAVVAYGAAVRATLRRRTNAIAGFTLLLWLFDLTRAWSVGDLSDASEGKVLRTLALDVSLLAASIMAPVLVEATGVRGWKKPAVIVLLTVLLVGIDALTFEFLRASPLVTDVARDTLYSDSAFLLRMWWTYSVAGLLFASFCHARDRELANIHAARTATLARAGAERDIVEMRVQVIQARVEPEILFGALENVRATYGQDPAAADALLDDLIAYLRAALPQMRRGASTVMREAALADAYLRVLPAGRAGRLVSELRIDESLCAAAFPPLVLLPLAQGAADAGASAVRIVGRANAEAPGQHVIEVVVQASALPPAWQGDALATVRAIVVQCFGAMAQASVESGDAGFTARIRWSPPAWPGDAKER